MVRDGGCILFCVKLFSTHPATFIKLVLCSAKEGIPVLVKSVLSAVMPIDGGELFVLSILIFGLLMIWSLVGGGITRIAALDYAKDESVRLADAMKFARKKFWSYFWSPLVPLIGVFFFALCNVVGGLMGRIPVVGEVVVALGFPFGLTCECEPVPGAFNPALEWSWTSSTVMPTALSVMMTPAIIDLNSDGIPDVVFGSTTNASGAWVLPGPLRAVSGDNGVELFSVISPDQFVNAASQLAVGDIDLDGKPEIVAVHGSGNRLITFEHDGIFKWLSPTLESVTAGGPGLADLDGDGTSEIIVGRQVLNSDGSLRWTGTGGRGDSGCSGWDIFPSGHLTQEVP